MPAPACAEMLEAQQQPEALQQLAMRVKHLEEEIGALRQQNAALEQKNEELVMSQSQLPDFEARLKKVLARESDLEAERQKHADSRQCKRCAELESQQAEIASAFAELQKLCSILFSGNTGSTLADSVLNWQDETQRIRLGGRMSFEPLSSAPSRPSLAQTAPAAIRRTPAKSQSQRPDSLRARYESPAASPRCGAARIRPQSESPGRVSRRYVSTRPPPRNAEVQRLFKISFAEHQQQSLWKRLEEERTRRHISSEDWRHCLLLRSSENVSDLDPRAPRHEHFPVEALLKAPWTRDASVSRSDPTPLVRGTKSPKSPYLEDAGKGRGAKTGARNSNPSSGGSLSRSAKTGSAASQHRGLLESSVGSCGSRSSTPSRARARSS